MICTCGTVLEESYPTDGDSHGICEPCDKELQKQIQDWKTKRLRELRMEKEEGDDEMRQADGRYSSR